MLLRVNFVSTLYGKNDDCEILESKNENMYGTQKILKRYKII